MRIRAHVQTSSFTLDEDVVLDTPWVTFAELAELDHHEWIGSGYTGT